MTTRNPIRSHGFRSLVLVGALLSIVSAALAEEGPGEAQAKDPGGDKVVAGMSIVGNDEAPKSLVIVPWKSSGLGQSLDVSRIMEDGRRPVDREVFGRELDYYEIRIGSAP